MDFIRGVIEPAVLIFVIVGITYIFYVDKKIKKGGISV